MPNTLAAVLCPDNPFAVIESAVLSEDTIDIIFDPLSSFAICRLRPIIQSLNVGKRVAGEVGLPLAHLKNPVLVVVDDDGKRKRRDKTVQ